MISSRPSPLSRTLALVPPTVLLAAQYASGAFTAYIQIDGIKGESTEEAHKDWIEVGSVQWGIGRAISSPTGGNREASAPSISEITLTKTLDSTSPALFLNAVGGGASGGVTVKLHLVETTAGGTGTVFYELILSNVLVSGISTSGSSGDGPPQESISLNFTKIEIAYNIADGKPLRAGYDLATAKPL